MKGLPLIARYERLFVGTVEQLTGSLPHDAIVGNIQVP